MPHARQPERSSARAGDSLLLDPGAGEFRRRLGPVPWCAFECLAARSRLHDGAWCAEASVRDLAAELGVAKNTAHRAVMVLLDAGLIEVTQDRSADDRFRRGHYRLHLDQAITKTTPAAAATARAARTRAERERSDGSPRRSHQLSLLGPV